MVKQSVETTTRPLPGHPGVTVSITTYLTPDEEIQCSEDEESWGVCAKVSVKVGPDEFTADAGLWDCRVSARSSGEDNRVYFLTLREEVAGEAIEELLVKLQACADGADLLWASRRTQAARAILGDGPDFTPRRRERP